MLVTPGHVKLSVPSPLSLQCCHHLSPAFPGLLVPHSWLSRVLGQLAERERRAARRGPTLLCFTLVTSNPLFTWAHLTGDIHTCDTLSLLDPRLHPVICSPSLTSLSLLRKTE